MAILPGSLYYLYYNGIIDHIPYEAYEMTPMTPSGYAQMSGMGTGYGNSIPYTRQSYLNQPAIPDTFVRRDIPCDAKPNYRQGILNSADRIGDGRMTKADWTKGILATGVIVLTGIGLIKGTGALFSKIKGFFTKAKP